MANEILTPTLSRSGNILTIENIDSSGTTIEIFKDDVLYHTIQLVPQLTVPSDVSVNQLDVMSVNSDTNAQQYEAFIDGNSIGTVSISPMSSPVVNAIDINFVDLTIQARTSEIEAFVDGQSIGTQSI